MRGIMDNTSTIVDISSVVDKASPDKWCYLEVEDMYLLNMKAKCNNGHIIDLDCIVALTEESKKLDKWYWHTRTTFCDYEGYEDGFKEALDKSMEVAFELFRRYGATRVNRDQDMHTSEVGSATIDGEG